jgi:hypothetical protein
MKKILLLLALACAAGAEESPLVQLSIDTGIATPPRERRELVVTNTRDAGEGSLRAAIEAANAIGTNEAVPVSIAFRIDEPAIDGVHTIRPLTQLPAITAVDIRIGTTNLDDRSVALDGSLAAGGSGLELRGEGFFEINGLVIRNFPWDGISVARRPSAQQSFIGYCAIEGNRSRGITLDAPTANVYVLANVLNHNDRSGLFIAGATDVVVRSGFANDNGASGMFVGPGSRNVLIDTNTTSRNAHFGVAIARGARRVRLKNVFFDGNRNLPVDHNLDGFSGHTFNGEHPPAPHIEAAFDAATNTTTVTGTFDAPDASTPWKVTLYNPFRVGEFGERPEAIVDGHRFTIILDGIVAGPISVIANPVGESDWSTSEFSNVVQLQP